jgi:hypothetical protein
MAGLKRCAAAVLCGASIGCFAASSEEMERLTTYAAVIGQAVACGADTSEATRAVGRWMDTTFGRASRAQHSYLVMFASELRFQAQQQKEKRPESCSPVLRRFDSFVWP